MENHFSKYSYLYLCFQNSGTNNVFKNLNQIETSSNQDKPFADYL